MNILILTHGRLGMGLLEAYNMIAGENERIYIQYLTDDGIEPFRQRVYEKLDEINKESKTLILTDIKGGTPYNIAMEYKINNPEVVEIVTGVNLQMLLEIGINIENHESITENAIEAIEIGKAGIDLCVLNDNLEDNLEF